MIDAEVSLYLASRDRLARLQKTVAFAALPRLREFVKVRNREHGDYFAFTVVQVTHRKGGAPEGGKVDLPRRRRNGTRASRPPKRR